MRQLFSYLVLATILSACQAHINTPPSPTPTPSSLYSERQKTPEWEAREDYDRASGNKSCSVSKGKVLFISVLLNGSKKKSVSLSAIGSEYPGSTFYAKFGGKRYNGEERINVTSKMMKELENSEEMDISWTNWPHGIRQQATVSLAGFKEASSCLK